ncbi:hypothetical protein B7486_01990 [cyanobacterium TDX16]|nr:hypothetical protein B7486_01990 [cyanobacterium TDX16]
MTPLHLAAAAGVDVMDALIKQSASDVNAADASGCTPLHMAVHRKDEKAVVYLLYAGGGADIG